MNNCINYTFIIPHKNVPSLVKRCVDSIPCRKDIEVIVVDDNSAPNNKPVFDRKNTKVILLDEAQSNGAGKARNSGLAEAAGKWILFADADDYYDEKLLETLDKYKDTDADVIYYSFLNVGNDNSCTTPEYHKWICSTHNKESRDKVKYLHNAPWNKMVRRSLIEEKGIRFEETINGNDVFYSLQVGWLAEKTIFEATPLYYYVYTPNSITNNKELNLEAILCQMTHLNQSNTFKDYIGYPGWKIPIMRYMLAALKNKGLKNFMIVLSVYIRNYQSIKAGKNKFVDYFKKFD